MKFIKGLLLIFAFLLLSGIIFAGVGWHLMHGEPDWYQPRAMSPVEREQAATRAEDKFALTVNSLSEFVAAERRAAASNPAAEPAVPQPIELDITADELNAVFLKWAEFYDWEERYGDSLADPMLHLHGGRMILAGTFIDIQSVVSLHYEPRIDEDGLLHMKLHRVMAGRLPLPQSLWNRGRDSLTRSLLRRLPEQQEEADIAPDGTANEAAMQAAFSRMLLSVLHQQPSDPVIFIPLADGQRVPVRISRLDVEHRSLQVTLHPLDRDQRERFLDHLREPYTGR